MSERTENQTKTEEEQARERVDFVNFRYGLRDWVLRLGTALSSLTVFGGVLYLAGGLHALSYFSAFRASWLVLELPGNFFLLSVLPQVLILISTVSVGATLIEYAESKRKAYAESKNWMKLWWWSWVGKLISRHAPHKESPVGFSLFILSVTLPILVFTLFRILPFHHPWMEAHPYWSSVLSALWVVVFLAWATFFALGSPNIKRDIFIGAPVFAVVVLTMMLVFSFSKSYVERQTTMFFMGVWGILFGIGVGVRILADLAHSNGDSLPKYSIPSPKEGWGAANTLPLHLAFVLWLSLFSITDGVEKSLYDQAPSYSDLPIVMLKDGSCRQALLITSRHVYTVALQSSEPLDVVPFSWEKISRIRAPLSGRCHTS